MTELWQSIKDDAAGWIGVFIAVVSGLIVAGRWLIGWNWRIVAKQAEYEAKIAKLETERVKCSAEHEKTDAAQWQQIAELREIMGEVREDLGVVKGMAETLVSALHIKTTPSHGGR